MGTALGRVLGGGPPGPSGGALCALVPPRGGWGPKKRHLVLYKLAGFCTADRRRRGAFFDEHTPPVKSENFRNFAKMCTFWPPKPPKMPILALFRGYFGGFFAPNSGGYPLGVFWGGPEKRGAWQSPHFRGPGGSTGGWGGAQRL